MLPCETDSFQFFGNASYYFERVHFKTLETPATIVNGFILDGDAASYVRARVASFTVKSQKWCFLEKIPKVVALQT